MSSTITEGKTILSLFCNIFCRKCYKKININWSRKKTRKKKHYLNYLRSWSEAGLANWGNSVCFRAGGIKEGITWNKRETPQTGNKRKNRGELCYNMYLYTSTFRNKVKLVTTKMVTSRATDNVHEIVHATVTRNEGINEKIEEFRTKGEGMYIKARWTVNQFGHRVRSPKTRNAHGHYYCYTT